jgi:hypothetical protein
VLTSRLFDLCLVKKKMKLILLLLTIVALASAQTTFPNGSFGDRVLLTFGRFAKMPLTIEAAENAGWALVNSSVSCNEELGGYLYSRRGGEPTKRAPQLLVFTEAGEFGGFGVRLFGAASDTLQERGFWSDRFGTNQLIVRTRARKAACNAAVGGGPVVGDRLVLLDNSEQGFEIPTTMSRAVQNKWSRGNCIPKMGTHFAIDVLSPGNMTWNAESLLPIMPMYRPTDGSISAVLINTDNAQTVFTAGGAWEGLGPAGFPSSIFCKNWCADSGCHWNDATGFTTLHWLFSDLSLNTCDDAVCKL